MGFVLHFKHLAQPRQFGVDRAVGGLRPAGFLVFPVRGNPVFGNAMHVLRANLHFQRAPARADDGCVERLI